MRHSPPAPRQPVEAGSPVPLGVEEQMTQHQRKLVAKRPCDQAGPARMEGEEGMRKAHARNSQGPTRIRPSYIRLARWQGLAQTKQSVPRVIGSPRGKHRLAGEPPGARDIIICRAGEGPGRADKACWQGVTLSHQTSCFEILLAQLVLPSIRAVKSAVMAHHVQDNITALEELRFCF